MTLPFDSIDLDVDTFHTEERVVEKSPPLHLIGIVAAAAIGLWVLYAATFGRSSETASGLVRIIANLPAEINLWQDPPTDHEPLVYGYPSIDTPVLGQDSDLSVVYVNSLGRPTVIDLDSGARKELVIAPGRSTDRFSVEFGNVVSPGGVSRNFPPATERAITFVLQRPSDASTAPTAPTGPLLCASEEGCRTETWQIDTMTNGTDSLEPFDETKHPEIAQLLFSAWPERGRFLLVDLGGDVAYQVPKPLNSEAWILHQPEP